MLEPVFEEQEEVKNQPTTGANLNGEIERALMKRPAVLIVEDDVTLEPLWSYVIEKAMPGAIVTWVLTEEAAEKQIQRRRMSDEDFDLIISDIFLQGSRNGLDLWRKYGSTRSQFLLMSVLSPSKLEAMFGSKDNLPLYVQKPLNPKFCIDVISTMMTFDDEE